MYLQQQLYSYTYRYQIHAHYTNNLYEDKS